MKKHYERAENHRLWAQGMWLAIEDAVSWGARVRSRAQPKTTNGGPSGTPAGYEVPTTTEPTK
eukprot:9438840-Karenia_brevis.AAC.1